MKANSLKYEVHVKWHGRWSIVAKCLTELDARLIADDRAKDTHEHNGKPEVSGIKIVNGGRLVYQLG